MKRVGIVAGVVLLLAACVGSEPTPTASSSSSGGSSSGGSSSGSTGTASAIGSFPFDTCDAFQPNEAAVSVDPQGQTGTACKVCTDGSTKDFYFARLIELNDAKTDQEYTLTYYLRSVPDQAVTGMLVGFESEDADEQQLDEEPAHPTLTTSFEKHSSTLKLVKPGVKFIKIFFGATATGDTPKGCFVVDEVVLTRK